MEEAESGFVGEVDVAGAFGGDITDVEVLRVSQVNVVARGRRHGRQWLLKGLSPELRDTTAGRRQLMKEFEVHSRLCNPAVVQAVDVEEVEGLGPCIVMEWVEGVMLSDLLREGKMPKHERRRIMRDIIVAVEYLHRNGVVHRDLKPANIMVRSAGREIVIIDFGLADTDSYVELKQAAGTRGFISPEQLENGGADPADDVYSIGVIMNELCPEYRRLARICTGPRGSRPADAGALLKIFDGRSRRRKAFAVAALVTLVAVLTAVGVWRIMALDEEARKSDVKMNALALENRRNAENASRLADSLENMHSRMKEAQEELDKTRAYDELYEKMYKAGCAEIIAKLEHFDKKIFPTLDPLYVPLKLSELDKEMQLVISQASKTAAASGLKEADASRIEGDLLNFCSTEIQKYYKKWLKR